MKRSLPWLLLVAGALALLDVQPTGPGGKGGWAAGAQGHGATELQVVEMDSKDVPQSCPDPEDCDGDYGAFAEKAAGLAPPRNASDLTLLLARAQGESPPPPTTDIDRAAVADALGVAFLLDGLDGRELLVVERSNVPRDGIQHLRLAFEDPWVGVFEALLVVAGTEPPWGGLVVHPGKGRTMEDAGDVADAAGLARAGVAVLVIQPRLDGGGEREGQVALSLLVSRTTMAGLRAYECLLARKYLRWRTDVDDDRIGLVAGDRASEVGEAALWLADWAAYSGDAEAAWIDAGEAGQPGGGSAPGLVGWGDAMRSGRQTPALRFPRGAPPSAADLSAFMLPLLAPGGGEQ